MGGGDSRGLLASVLTAYVVAGRLVSLGRSRAAVLVG